jgi:hypothetical protein
MNPKGLAARQVQHQRKFSVIGQRHNLMFTTGSARLRKLTRRKCYSFWVNSETTGGAIHHEAIAVGQKIDE